jgi:DNA-binding transcriptional LysR family regulator
MGCLAPLYSAPVMRTADRFEGLSAFLAVAQRKSFRAAATQLGVTPGAVSQSIRALERRVGLPLFQRTTRSVALTEAGQVLLSRVEPAHDALRDALSSIEALRARPAGVVRLTVPRMAVPLFVTPVLPLFRKAHPDVAVEVSVDDALVDLASGGFDAGIRMGEALAQDMIGVRLSPDLRWCVVGTPSYFAQWGHPATPRELAGHATIRYRLASSNAIYRWEFENKGRAFSIDVPGTFTVNDGALGVELALARKGLCLAYTADVYIARELEAGTLVTTLNSYAPKSAGFFVYFPAGAQKQPKLRAFVDTLVAFTASQTKVPQPARKPRRLR